MGGEWLHSKTQKEFWEPPVPETGMLLEERLKKFRERGAKAGTRHLLETMAFLGFLVTYLGANSLNAESSALAVATCHFDRCG